MYCFIFLCLEEGAQYSDFRMSVLLLSLTSKHKLRNAHEIIILLQACTLLLPPHTNSVLNSL